MSVHLGKELRQEVYKEAKKLREEGFTYRNIAELIGVSAHTIRMILNPEARERARVKQNIKYQTDEYFKEHKRVQPKTEKQIQRDAFRSRCKYALKQGRTAAKRFGWVACNASVEELEISFTGRCEICQVKEEDCSKRLCMDHCHQTGKFRGWLCSNCNLGIGYLKEKNLEKAILFLKNKG